jgi:hypothetical protein
MRRPGQAAVQKQQKHEKPQTLKYDVTNFDTLKKSAATRHYTARLLKAKSDNVVVGVVYSPCHKGEACQLDTQKDWMYPDDLRKMARDYLANAIMSKRPKGPVGIHHVAKISSDQAVPVESFIAPVDFTIDTFDGPEPVKKDDWVLYTRISDALKQRHQSGELGAYSIDGNGLRIPESP